MVDRQMARCLAALAVMLLMQVRPKAGFVPNAPKQALERAHTADPAAEKPQCTCTDGGS